MKNKNLKILVDDVVIKITIRSTPDGNLSIMGYGKSTSVRCVDCQFDPVLLDFACVLLYANQVEDSESNANVILNTIKNEIHTYA